MKKEYDKATDSMHASFEAGRVCDDFGCPMPFWNCYVSYTWSDYLQAFWVYSVCTAGFGVTEDKVTSETVMKTSKEVDHLLEYIKDMETCFKKVYGE